MLLLHTVSPMRLHPLGCRLCGTTRYRRVVLDVFGEPRPTGLYKCSGCSVVFADPTAWRDGEIEEGAGVPPPPLQPRMEHPPLVTSTVSKPIVPFTPEWTAREREKYGG